MFPSFFMLTSRNFLVMHCHIDWHLAEGFAAVVIVQPDAVAQMSIPSASTAVSN
jgi:hypothetical protein